MDNTANEERKQYLISIQAQQLKGWESVLKPEIFKELKDILEADNKIVTVADQVKRGSMIDNILFNQLMKR